MTAIEELLAEVLQRNLKPKTKLNTHEWSGKHVRLDDRFTARPGMYDVSYTPYMRGPHEWFSDPHIREITGCKSRQVGGTTFLGNCMMYAVGEDPGPILYVTSTGDNAQSFSEREWQPRIELSPLLKSLKPANADDFKKREQHFKTCTVRLVGSNSPANLMSRAIRYLFEDEIDTWPMDNGAEAPSIEIVEACTLSYAHARKILRISTPTVETGAIWTFFLRGSQHKYFVPCPHCDGKKFELKFEMLNFHKEETKVDGVWNLDAVKKATTLTCPCCHKDIEQIDQPRIVDQGEWIATNPDAPSDHISWHISALYSPTISWGEIAVLFLQKSGTPGGLHDFYNHYLGLPFSRKSTQITVTDVERVRDHSPEYISYSGPSWIAPANFELVLMSVDVQQDGFWWAHRGVCMDETSYLIDYGPASGWEDIWELSERRYKLPNNQEVMIYKALIDSGYKARRQSGVYDFVIRSGGRFMPVQGRSVQHGLFQPLRETQFEHRGYMLDAVQLRDDLYKESLYIRRIKERGGAGWFLPKNISELYKAQVTDEKLVAKKSPTGKEVLEWEDHGNNHLGDVEKYMLGGIDLVTPFLRALRENDPVEEEDQEDDRRQESLTMDQQLEQAISSMHVPKSPRESVEARRKSDPLELPS